MKLLIIEDHHSLSELLSQRLIHSGFSVDVASHGEMAFSLLKQWEYDLLILDLGLPDIDGVELLKRLRKQHDFTTACIIVSARDALQSRIDGLDAGADDYMVKPFDIAELEARIRALLRRPKSRQQEALHLGNLCAEPWRCEASVNQHPLELARREYLLLEELIRNSGRVVIKDHLEDRLYGCDEPASRNAVEALISRVRRKLQNAGANCVIETVRGLGYRMRQPS